MDIPFQNDSPHVDRGIMVSLFFKDIGSADNTLLSSSIKSYLESDFAKFDVLITYLMQPKRWRKRCGR